MFNELVSQDPQKSALENIIEKINFPHLIASPAGDALSRLIGGAAGLHPVWMTPA
jgi:hypothetical protein